MAPRSPATGRWRSLKWMAIGQPARPRTTRPCGSGPAMSVATRRTMRDVALAISTCDRYPATNYFLRTWENLVRSGVLNSDRLHSIHIASDWRPDTGRGLWPERLF